jgi:O-antigen/teichoic acid export membrane protein
MFLAIKLAPSGRINQTVKQTFILSVSNALTRGMGMLFFIVLARSLTVAEFGLFRYLLTLSTIYALAFVGIPTALTKFLGDSGSDQDLKTEYLSNSLFLSVLVYLALAIVVLLFASHNILLLLFILTFLVDIFYVGFARGILDYLKLNGFKLFENVIQLAILISVYFFYRHIDFNFSVVFYSFSGLLSLAVFEIIRPNFKIKWRYSMKRIMEILRYAVPVTFGALGWTLLYGISNIYVEHFNGTEQVGYFSVGLTLMQVFSFFPDAIYTILMPKVAGLKDKRKILRPLRMATLGCLGVFVLISIPLILFPGLIVSFLFSPKYMPAVAVILPLMIGQLFLTLYKLYGTSWQGLGKPAITSIIIAIAAGINIVVGYFLTRSFGIVGASVSLTISAFATWVVTILFWRRWVKRGGLEAIGIENGGL